MVLHHTFKIIQSTALLGDLFSEGTSFTKQHSVSQMLILIFFNVVLGKIKFRLMMKDICRIKDCSNKYLLVKILKEMGIPDHLTSLLRNVYAGQEATVRTGHGTTDWFQIGKGVCQGCILSPCLFNLYAESVQFSRSVVSDSL